MTPAGHPVDRPGRATGPTWLDSDAGPVVRPYTLTRGRARPAAGFDVVAFVVTTAAAAPPPRLEPEERAILALVRRPTPVAEVAARLDLPLGVVRVLLGDLLQYGLITVYEPPDTDRYHVLQALVDGLRAL